MVLSLFNNVFSVPLPPCLMLTLSLLGIKKKIFQTVCHQYTVVFVHCQDSDTNVIQHDFDEQIFFLWCVRFLPLTFHFSSSDKRWEYFKTTGPIELKVWNSANGFGADSLNLLNWRLLIFTTVITAPWCRLLLGLHSFLFFFFLFLAFRYLMICNNFNFLVVLRM